MKVTVFNDTRVDWRLHVGSERGIGGERDIPKHASVDFEVPDGCDVFVKVWGKMVMVRYEGGGALPYRDSFPSGYWEPHISRTWPARKMSWMDDA